MRIDRILSAEDLADIALMFPDLAYFRGWKSDPDQTDEVSAKRSRQAARRIMQSSPAREYFPLEQGVAGDGELTLDRKTAALFASVGPAAAARAVATATDIIPADSTRAEALACYIYSEYVARIGAALQHMDTIVYASALAVAVTRLSGGGEAPAEVRRDIRAAIDAMARAFVQEQARALNGSPGRPAEPLSAKKVQELRDDYNERQAERVRRGQRTNKAIVLGDMSEKHSMSPSSLDHILFPRRRRAARSRQG